MKRSVMLMLWLLLGTVSAFDSSAVPWASPPDRYPPDRYPPDRYPLGRSLPDRYPLDRYPPDRYPPDRYPPDRYPLGRSLPDRSPPDRSPPPPPPPPDRSPPPPPPPPDRSPPPPPPPPPPDRSPPDSSPPDLYTMVRNMTAELARMEALINTVKAQLDTEVSNLKKQDKASQVAFSACLVAGGNRKNIGPTSTTLVFSHVPLNIGNVYNPITGMFIAPVKGVYHFDWTVGAFGDGSRGSGAWLMKNSEKVALVFEIQKDGFMSGSKGVSLSLLKGDMVSLRLLGNSLVFDDYNCLTTFSGHLLFIV